MNALLQTVLAAAGKTGETAATTTWQQVKVCLLIKDYSPSNLYNKLLVAVSVCSSVKAYKDYPGLRPVRCRLGQVAWSVKLYKGLK